MTDSTAAPARTAMTHGQILESMTGLMLSMFVAMLSATVVSNALPTILHDLHGGESAYTWVVTATLLATTASTPLWGKLADLTSKKLLMQTAIVVYIAGSVVAGLSQSIGMLIACRVVQGLGAGGILAMTQVIMAAMVSPRERGRYSGYLGATFAVATIAGPLVGGVLVDTSWLGWRWCFYVGVPFAAAALVVLQRTLHLPVVRREITVDYLGAALITGGVSVLLVWASLAGQQFDWASGTTALLVALGVALLAAAVAVELHTSEPVIPLQLFRHRTVSLATGGGLFVGVAMYGATIFLAQYFQIARGESPTASGLRTMPMILGLAIASLVTGRLVSSTGRWKRFLVLGTITSTVGFALLSTIDARTSFVLLSVYMALVGLGLGMALQNLVLSVQNTVPARQLGAATATVSFFRSLGGAIGVSVLGAVLGSRVNDSVASGLSRLGVASSAVGGSDASIPDVRTLPAPVARIVEDAYGTGVGHVFLISAPMMLIAFLAVVLIKEVPLRQQSGTELVAGLEQGGAPGEVSGQAVESVVPEAVAPQPVAPQPVAPRGLAVTGTVTAPDARPLGGASVTLTDLAGRQLGRAHTDDSGRYAVVAPSGGAFLLICATDRYQPAATLVNIADGPVRQDVALTAATRVRGRVRSEQDAVAEAFVTLIDLRGQVVGSAVTGRDGSYLLDDLLAGDYTLTATSDGHLPRSRAVSLDPSSTVTVDIDLVRSGEVAGVVRTASTGQPLPGAMVTVVDAAGDVVAHGTTDAAGRYCFGDLTPGSYTVTSSGYPPVAVPAEVAGGRLVATDVPLGQPAAPSTAHDSASSDALSQR